MTFGSTFGRTFSPSFQPKSQAAAVAGGGWWDLDGTITSCIGAYQAKGAASLTASYVNLANSGTYDLTTSTNSVDWSTSAGWSGFSSSNSKYLKTGIKVSSVNMSAIVRMANVSSNVSIPFGCSISSPDRRFAILPNLSGHIYYEYGAATTGWLDITSTVTGAAVMAIAGANGYRNGTPETGSISSVA